MEGRVPLARPSAFPWVERGICAARSRLSTAWAGRAGAADGVLRVQGPMVLLCSALDHTQQGPHPRAGLGGHRKS